MLCSEDTPGNKQLSAGNSFSCCMQCVHKASHGSTTGGQGKVWAGKQALFLQMHTASDTQAS